MSKKYRYIISFQCIELKGSPPYEQILELICEAKDLFHSLGKRLEFQQENGYNSYVFKKVWGEDNDNIFNIKILDKELLDE